MPENPAISPSLSVVIPAHNEEAVIGAALQRVLEQGDLVHEVIVVDNNCTDDTAGVVRRIAADDDRVHLVEEQRPGVAHARYAGFDAAAGDLIATIDADTVVGEGWAEAITTLFAERTDIDAGGAPMLMHDLPLQGMYAAGQRRYLRSARRILAEGGIPRLPGLSGANSVLRASAWTAVRDSVSTDRAYHEDMDRSLALLDAGCTIAVVPGMDATVSGRRALSSVPSFWRYSKAMPRTYRRHGRRVAAVVVDASIAIHIVWHTVLLPVNRAWDPERERFSLRRLLTRTERRAEPVG